MCNIVIKHIISLDLLRYRFDTWRVGFVAVVIVFGVVGGGSVVVNNI